MGCCACFGSKNDNDEANRTDLSKMSWWFKDAPLVRSNSANGCAFPMRLCNNGLNTVSWPPVHAVPPLVAARATTRNKEVACQGAAGTSQAAQTCDTFWTDSNAGRSGRTSKKRFYLWDLRSVKTDADSEGAQTQSTRWSASTKSRRDTGKAVKVT